ncbi:MAG: hypothetical protein ACK52I_09025 [Pseudomonadota bacterium]
MPRTSPGSCRSPASRSRLCGRRSTSERLAYAPTPSLDAARRDPQADFRRTGPAGVIAASSAQQASRSNSTSSHARAPPVSLPRTRGAALTGTPLQTTSGSSAGARRSVAPAASVKPSRSRCSSASSVGDARSNTRSPPPAAAKDISWAARAASRARPGASDLDQERGVAGAPDCAWAEQSSRTGTGDD